jgi:uncharacterized protein YxjI
MRSEPCGRRARRGHCRLDVTASYAVEVAPGEDDLLILASVLALDLAIDAEHDH